MLFLLRLCRTKDVSYKARVGRGAHRDNLGFNCAGPGFDLQLPVEAHARDIKPYVYLPNN